MAILRRFHPALSRSLGARADVKLSTKILSKEFSRDQYLEYNMNKRTRSRGVSAYERQSKQILPSNEKTIGEVQIDLINISDKTAQVKINK